MKRLVPACATIALSILAWGLILPPLALAQSAPSYPCWTANQCDVVQGDFDSTGKDSKDCQPLNNELTARCFVKDAPIKLQVPIPGLGSTVQGGFPAYLAAFYKFFVAMLAVSAVVMAMWGGFKRIMAAGSPEKIKDSNDAIVSAITGLILALVSYSLLNLINPRLVNSTSLKVDIVQTQVSGMCPTYQAKPRLYQSGYSITTCSSGSNIGMSCIEDSQCPGGRCVAGPQTTQVPGSTCGQQLVFNNARCIGQECTSTNQGCFSIAGSGTARYACSDYMVQGSLSGVAITNLDLMMVCNNNTTSAFDCSVSEPNGSNEDTVGVKNHSAYALNGCWANDGNGNFNRLSQTYCSGAGGLKGVALLAQVQAPGVCTNQISGHGLGCDDWYAIDKSSCNTTLTKPINGASAPTQNDPKAPLPFSPRTLIDWRLRWDGVSQTQLFNPFDVNGNMVPIQCNLNISHVNFPDRDDIY